MKKGDRFTIDGREYRFVKKTSGACYQVAFQLRALTGELIIVSASTMDKMRRVAAGVKP